MQPQDGSKHQYNQWVKHFSLFFKIYILQLEDNLPDMVTTYDRDPRSLNLRMKYLDTRMYITIIYCVYNNDLNDILILIIDDLVSPQLLVAVIIF